MLFLSYHVCPIEQYLLPHPLPPPCSNPHASSVQWHEATRALGRFSFVAVHEGLK